jgi:hypothetical protein
MTVPGKGGRPKGRVSAEPTRDWEQVKLDFLEGYKKFGTMKGACDFARVDHRKTYQWERDDEGFRLAWKGIRDDITDELYGGMLERARKVAEPELPVAERKLSMTMGIFILKAEKPEKFRDNYRYQQFRMLEAQNKSLKELSDDELKRLLADIPPSVAVGVGDEGLGDLRDAGSREGASPAS